MLTPPEPLENCELTASPVPVSAEVCGLAPSPPLYVAVSVVERAPVAEGVKVTTRVQFALAASVEPQVLLDTAKSAALPPLGATVSPVADAELLFVSVKVTGELGEPTNSEPNDWLAGVSATVPLPLSN
jgi:hypothetical protein